MDYQLIRSRRRTIAVQVTGDGIVVRAPLRTTRREADAFVQKHKDWIIRQTEKQSQLKSAAAAVPPLSEQEIRALYDRAREVLPPRVQHYADLLGAPYGRITVRCQRTRWGSCSQKGNLNFNCLLMLTPPEVIDAVVVHEVCHLIEMNHSRSFYELVERLYPDYHRWDRWLKDHGKLLMARVSQKQPESEDA